MGTDLHIPRPTHRLAVSMMVTVVGFVTLPLTRLYLDLTVSRTPREGSL